MTTQRRGNKFPLILYRKIVGRYRWLAFLIALTFGGAWYGVKTQLLTQLAPSSADPLAAGSLIAIIYWLYAWLSPRLAFAQARHDHLLIRTPFFRMRVPYHLIRNTRPVDPRKVFFPSSLKPRDRNLLRLYRRQTALGVDLLEFPRPPWTLRLFLHRLFFAPDRTGLLLYVRNWQALSQQISVRLDAWRMGRDSSRRGAVSDAAYILNDEEG
jgi:hypothetical protein